MLPVIGCSSCRIFAASVLERNDRTSAVASGEGRMKINVDLEPWHGFRRAAALGDLLYALPSLATGIVIAIASQTTVPNATACSAMSPCHGDLAEWR